MQKRIMTREFSICLLPGEEMANDVNALRKELPPSPYRDDVPHITLLRGITAPTDMPDEALVRKVDSMLAISDYLPLNGRVQTVANKSNQFYSSSGTLLIQPSPELLDFRKAVAAQLQGNKFVVEAQELTDYTPHITIRLGVPLEASSMQKAEEMFNDRIVTFSRWVLFRLIKEGDTRIMHEAWPSPR